MALDLDGTSFGQLFCFLRLNSAGTVSKTFLMLSTLMSRWCILPVKRGEKSLGETVFPQMFWCIKDAFL